jgi:hypothetical protein
MTSLSDGWRPALACLCLVWLTACASASSPEQMSVTGAAAPALAPGAAHYHSFRLDGVSGGGNTSPIGLSDVSNDALHQALRSSLDALGYLAPGGAGATYVVSADIVDLDRPAVALDPVLIFVPVDLSVTARIRYLVTPAAGGRAVFDEVVATTGTATGADALTPAGRIQRANEAAVRLNIAAFLQRFQAQVR